MSISGTCAPTCTISGAPVAGEVLSVFLVNNNVFTGIIVKDSTGATLTQHLPANNCVSTTICVAVYDETVVGSPTTALTVSGGTLTNTSGQTQFGLHMFNVTTSGAAYAAGEAASVPPATTAALGTVTQSSIVECFTGATSTSSGQPQSLIDNTTALKVFGLSQVWGQAAQTVSTNCSALNNLGGTDTNQVTIAAAYPGTTTPGFSGDMTGYTGDRLFEQMLQWV